MKKIKANERCYSATKRERKNVKYIVIHNTGNKNDTAESNGKFFTDPYKWETRSDGTKVKVPLNVGTHFIIDQNGIVVKSVNLNRTAWAVGGDKWDDCRKTGGGKLYGIANNKNSVSIELCDIIDREPSEEMMKAIWRTIKYIQKYCPNADNVIRHFDVNGKHCPLNMMNEEEWNEFKFRLLDVALRY